MTEKEREIAIIKHEIELIDMQLERMMQIPSVYKGCMLTLTKAKNWRQKKLKQLQKTPWREFSLHCVHSVIQFTQKGGNDIADSKPTFDKGAYDAEYQKKNVVRVIVPLNRKHDADIIGHLKEKKSKSAYIKQLIRDDMQ